MIQNAALDEKEGQDTIKRLGTWDASCMRTTVQHIGYGTQQTPVRSGREGAEGTSLVQKFR